MKNVHMLQHILIANSVDPDQTAPLEQSDQGLHCLLRQSWSNIPGNYRSGFLSFYIHVYLIYFKTTIYQSVTSLWGMDTLSGEVTLPTSILPHSQSEKGSTLKRKNLLLFPFKVDPFSEGI